MRELWIVILFRLKVVLRAMFRLRGGTLVMTILGFLVLAGFFALMMFAFVTMFVLIARHSPELALNIFVVQVVALSALILLQTVPTMASDLFDQKGFFSFLLFYPIGRGNLVVSSLVASASAALLPLIVLLPAVLGYALAIHTPGAIAGILSYIVFMVGVMLWGSVSVARVFSVGALRKFSRWMGVVNILLFVAYANLMGRQYSVAERLGPRINPSGVLGVLLVAAKMLFSGDIVIVLLTLTVGIYACVKGYSAAKLLKLDLSTTTTTKRRKISKKLWANPWTRRDFLILVRDPEMYILYAYPVLFGLIFGVMRSPEMGFLGMFSAVLFASQGATISAVRVLAQDIKNRVWVATLPVDMRKLFVRRAMDISLFWSIPILIFTVAVAVWKPEQVGGVLSVVPAIISIFGNILMGQHYGAHKLAAGVERPRNAVGLQGLALSAASALYSILPLVPLLLKSSLPDLYRSLFYAGIISSLVLAVVHSLVLYLIFRNVDVRAHFRR